MLNTVPTKMCHITIITYHIIRKFALQCGNWKRQQRLSLFMSAYQNNKETVSLTLSLSVFRPVWSVIYVTNIQFRYNHMI